MQNKCYIIINAQYYKVVTQNIGNEALTRTAK